MGKVKAVCISKKKGTVKKNIDQCEVITDHGLKGDAHAGSTHRQVSLLSFESFNRFSKKYGDIEYGAFGENLLIEGIDPKKIICGTKIRCGSLVLEVTQIGKECHSDCEISKRTGNCIMPKEGIFTRVLKGGMVHVGDNAEICGRYRLGVITASDKGSSGERIDKSGPFISEITEEFGYETVCRTLLPDDEDAIFAEIVRMCDIEGCDIVITTGGTGFSERDRTPEATFRAATRQASGIAEAIRAECLKITPMAMLSRGTSVIRNRTLIVNLPGSPKAVKEALDIILPTLSHGIDILKGNTSECAGISR